MSARDGARGPAASPRGAPERGRSPGWSRGPPSRVSPRGEGLRAGHRRRRREKRRGRRGEKEVPRRPGQPEPRRGLSRRGAEPARSSPAGARPGPARGRSLTLRLHLLPPPRSGARRAAASRAGLRGYKGGRRARGVGFLSLPLQLHRAVRRRQRDEAPLKAAEAGGAPAARLGTARPGRGGERRGAEGMGSPRRPGASCPQAAAGR